jgi:hypothetical protein
MKSPFILENQTEYQKWRTHKLSLYPINLNKLSVSFNNKNIDNDKINKLKDIVKKYNFAIYDFTSKLNDNHLQNFCTKLDLINFVSNLLADSKGISTITDQVNTKSKLSGIEYIPYTNKQLNWHTDGYYYPINTSVKSFLLHCMLPAKSGGENILLDHEIIYIYLRDHNPDFIEILMQNNIMEIPKNKNKKNSQSIIGPVFYTDEDGFLNMRFTSRQQNIIWQKNDMIKQIKDFIYSFIMEDNKYKFNVLLKENQGYVANNILHKREEYTDGKNKRLLKRLRFSKRIK